LDFALRRRIKDANADSCSKLKPVEVPEFDFWVRRLARELIADKEDVTDDPSSGSILVKPLRLSRADSAAEVSPVLEPEDSGGP
jgi:hypothetical protein